MNEFRSIALIYASETGMGAALCQEAHRALNAGGWAARTLPIDAWDGWPQDGELCLFACSSTGNGEMPTTARNFVARLAAEDGDAQKRRKATPLFMSMVRLCDSSYEACGLGAETLERKLGELFDARPVCPAGKADAANGQTFAGFRAWLDAAMAAAGLGGAPAPDNPLRDRKFTAKLTERRRIDRNPEGGKEAWAIRLKTRMKMKFRAGDLISLLTPGSNIERRYSLASAQGDDFIDLLVGFDPRLSQEGIPSCSRYLTHELGIGESLAAKWREHPTFNLPDPGDPSPVILVSAGVGLAPMLGFIRELPSTPRNAWLIFGNAHSRQDDYFREEIERALKQGTLTKADLVFDNETPGFAQGALSNAPDECWDWIENKKAILYVCGRRSAVGNGTLEAVRQVAEQKLGGKKESDAYMANLARENRIRLDLFG